MGKIGKVAIFCGSKTGNNELYARHAKEAALLLAKYHIELVYGGGRKGLMGIVADTVMSSSGIARGVIPQVLVGWEHQHEHLSELLVVDDMHVRKRKMYELCDAALILPGGFGTLDELFEILTWNQLSIHDKKVFILNSGGFYRHLLDHMKFLSDEGFLWGKLEEQMVVMEEPAEMEGYMSNEG
jgi:uncharacterized protein (TIGR00730 family)